MVSVNIDPRQIDRIKAAVAHIKGDIKKEMAAAVNATAKITTSHIAKQVQTQLSVTQTAIKENLKVGIKAKPASPSTEVTFKYSWRIPLSNFSPRASKKGGVSVKVSPSVGRHVIRNAFIIPRFGNRVFRRKGKSRLPIVQLRGASPLRVYMHHFRLKPLLKVIEERLVKDLEKRINYLVHKAAGTLRGNQKA